MNTREKAAKALYDLTALYSAIPWAKADDECRAYYLTRVDAVLNAIPEPSEVMIRAARAAFRDATQTVPDWQAAVMRATWAAMIESILSGEG